MVAARPSRAAPHGSAAGGSPARAGSARAPGRVEGQHGIHHNENGRRRKATPRPEEAIQASHEPELAALFRELCDWGTWGSDDELGTLNHITPRSVREAMGLVRSGRLVSAGHDIVTQADPPARLPALNAMLYTGRNAITATDLLVVAPHGRTVTHLDAITHTFFGEFVYPGLRVADVVRADGLRLGSVHAQRNGIVTRGVLLDVARARGVPYLSGRDTIVEADLTAAERLAGVTVREGDAIVVRAGIVPWQRAEGPEDGLSRPGLAVECLRWIRRKGVAVYAGDVWDKMPSPFPSTSHPFHAVGIAGMGLVMLDNVDAEPLADAVREEGRAEFLFIASPLRVPKATGSAVNPLCVF